MMPKEKPKNLNYLAIIKNNLCNFISLPNIFVIVNWVSSPFLLKYANWLKMSFQATAASEFSSDDTELLSIIMFYVKKYLF